MALSFIQWEKYIQGFPDDRLGQEFQDPGSTVPGPEKPPQGLIVSEMGNRNAARQADEAMRNSPPSDTVAQQTFDEFSGGNRPVGGPGGGPPLGPGGPPPGGPPGGPGGPPGGPGGGPPGGGPGGPPMGGPPPGGPPPGGPPPGGPPMMAHGGLIPGYEEGGFMSGVGRLFTGAGSLEEAAENPFRTLGHTALSGLMFIPGVGLVSGAGRMAARGLGSLLKGKRATKGLRTLGGKVLGLEGKGGIRKALGRALGAPKNEPQGRWVTDLIRSSERVPPLHRGVRIRADAPLGAGARGAARVGSGAGRAGAGAERAGSAAGRVASGIPRIGGPGGGRVTVPRDSTMRSAAQSIIGQVRGRAPIGGGLRVRGGGRGLRKPGTAVGPYLGRGLRKPGTAVGPYLGGAPRAGAARAARAGRAGTTEPGWATRVVTTPTKRWVPGTAVRAGDLPLEVGKRALLRGGTAAGIAGLLAMDPFDAGEVGPKITTDIKDTNAMIEDGGGGYGSGFGYPEYEWLNEEMPVERDLRDLTAYRSDSGFNDFQDEANQEWLGNYLDDYPANMASGGIVSLQNGGDVPAGISRVPQDDDLGGYTFDVRSLNPLPWMRRMREAQLERIERAPHDPGYWSNVPSGRSYYDTERNRQKRILDEGGEIPENVARLPDLWGAERLRGEGSGDDSQMTPRQQDILDMVFNRDRGGEDPLPDTTGTGGGSRAFPADLAAEDVQDRRMELFGAQDLWGRTETPAEKELADFYRERSRQTREDDSKSALFRDVARAIGGSGGRPGGIGLGLADAIDAQMGLSDKAAAYDEIPLGAAAGRSRYNTYEGQQQALSDIFQAASSRGNVNAQVAGQLQAARMALEETGKLTAPVMMQMQSLLEHLYDQEVIDDKQFSNLLSRVVGRGMREYGIGPQTLEDLALSTD